MKVFIWYNTFFKGYGSDVIVAVADNLEEAKDVAVEKICSSEKREVFEREGVYGIPTILAGLETPDYVLDALEVQAVADIFPE